MGYFIYIGERHDYEDEDGEVNFTVSEVTIESSPSGDVPTAHTNGRWPSYSGWANFCNDTGLGDTMAELMPDHPGIADLNELHLNRILEVDKESISEYNKERIDWLTWWVKWALDNCKRPSFYNS